jgi:hypothetical protein
MPITVYIKGLGEVDFPDNMTEDQIKAAIKRNLAKQQTPKQQTPVQQNKVATVKNQPIQKEEPSIWDKTKSFLGFGEEETKPVTTAKKQPVTKPLISQEFVEKLPETGYQAPKETISILDNEYEKKKKAVEDKYNALQNAKSNVEISSFSGGMGSQPSIRYKVNYNQQKQLELDALDVEKAKKQGKNITPIEQTYYGVKYDEAKKASQTKIETLSKQKKSYKEELGKVEGFAMGASVFGAIKAIKNTWEHNTQVDAQIAEEERQVRQTERKIELNKSGVSVFKNVDLTNDAEVIKAASLIDPTIKSDIKEARKKIGEETTKLFPTAIKQTKVKDTGFLSELPDFSSINPAIALIEGFINYTKVGKFKNLTYEQYQRQALEKSLSILENEQNIELSSYYDDIQSSIGVPKTKVNTKINEYINLSNGFNINELPIEDQKLFNNPSFQALANVFVNRSIPAIGEDKKKIISMANMNKYIGEKRKLFGNLNKVENIGKEEAVASAILDKNLEEQGTFSSAGFDNLLYNSTKFLTRSGDFVVNQTAAGAQIISQVVTADKYTPKWTEKILDNTDLFDNLTEEDSHFKLDFFKDDKYYIGETPSGIKYHAKLDADMDIENAFGGGFEYTINNPEVMEEIAKDFYANKEKYVASAKTLADIEGGTSVFIENLWNSVQKEFAQEIPSLIVEGGAGGLVNAAIKKSLAKGVISSTEKAQKIARGADFLINTASAMTEMYPSIYKKYKEAAEDKDNHMPALLASGALAMGTYMTSFLQSKAIGLNGDFSTQRIMPGAIDATLETARILRKELANVADLSLREKLFNASLRKAMYQNVMKVAGKSMKDATRSGLEEAAEETILEPLINLGVNFLNEKITGDKAYNQESLADLNFLDPNTAAVSALTGSSLSTGMDLMKTMTSKNPYSREDYLKAAFENEATFTSYVDVMTESSSNKFSKEDQAKMMTDYKALKDAYNAKKSELGVNEEALSTLNFKNPIIKSMMGNIGLREEDLEKVNSEKTFDNAIIRQSLNERDLAEKKIALDEEVEKGNLTVNAQGAYKTVGSNPLTKELETKVSEFEKLQLSSNNLSTFIDTFNKGTKNVQKEYVLEMDEATSAAPDILDVKNSSEGSYAYKALSTSVMDKQMAVSQLAEVNTKINDAKLDGQDTKDLEVTKKELETTIKNSDKAINNIKKQYKAGRTETQLEVESKLRDVNTAQSVLAEKLRILAQVEASGEEVDNSEVDQVFSEYENTVKELNKANNKLKKGYGVSLVNKEYKPMTRQSFTELKEKIKEKNVVSEKVAGGKATLGELESLLSLEYETGSKEFTGRTDITTPKTKEDIDAILSNNEQLYEVAKRLGLDNKKSLAQTKKAVKSYLTKQLSSQDETKLESISAIFSPKTVVQKNGSTLFEVNGELFLPVGNTTSMATMSEEEKNTVLTNAVITEIAKQIFNNALVYTPYNLRQLINKVIVDSGFDTEISINENTLNIIIATISELKSDLDANGFAYKLNDDVVTSNFLYLSFDRGYEGMSTPPILTVVDNEGNVHLIDFRSYSDNYVADTNTWSKELTEMQGIFADNGISVSSINVLPIRVNNSYSTANGLTTLNINKQSFNVIANNDNPISKTLLQLANDLPTLENLQEEGLLTEEEVEEFALIPMEEGVTEDKTVEKELPFTEQEYDEMVSNEFENVSDTIVEKLRNKITNGEKLSPKEFDVVSFAEGKFTEEEISKAREKYIEIDLTPIDIPTTEEEIKAEEVNKPAETIGENIIEEDTETYFAGLSRGVYIRVKPINDSFMIEIFGDNELANKYGKKKYTKEDLKNIYAENGWRAPKVFKEGKYQVLDKVTNNPILSKNYIEYVYPQGFNEVVNDVTKVGEIIGTQVEIVENNEGGYNDNPEVQKDFKNKASLAIVMNGEKIGLVPQGSPIREKLAVKKVKGVTRLQPTTARVKDVKLKDFNHQNLMPFSEWENEALASGVLVPGQYEIVYIGINNEKPVFKNKNGVVVSGTVPKDPTLGASYLMLTNIPTRNVIIPMMTPKLKEIGYTLEDMRTIFKLIDRNILTKGTEAEGEKLYLNFVDAVNAIPKESLKDPKLAALKNYLSLELGGKTLPLRASYTQSQLDKLESILAYNNANQDLNDGLLSSFVLNRLITLNDNTIGDHQIGVNPDILFSDNELVLDNLESNKPVKKQVLPSAVAKNKNTDLVKDTYYESFLTETEDGENYVFFHKSNAPVEEISTGIDSRKFNSLRTSKEEKATQYGVASYYTLPTDGERMVGGDVYTVKVPKKQVYPMNTDPNGYRSIAESKIAENAPYREANIKKEMVRMAAEDGYKMAVGNWYYDPAGNPISGPAMRADAIVPLVPETLSYKKATDKEIDHPLKARIKAINSLMEIAKEFEEARRDVQDYSEGYHIAQDLRIYGRIPTNTQFDIMVANLPEKVQGKAEEAIKLISIINSAQEESPSGAASELMSSVVGRLKETGLANEVFEMSNAEIEEKLIELGVDAETAKQVTAWHGGISDFEKFSSNFIGSGEGGMLFGYGYYFDGDKKVAERYATMVANEQSNQGRKVTEGSYNILLKGRKLGNTKKGFENLNVIKTIAEKYASSNNSIESIILDEIEKYNNSLKELDNKDNMPKFLLDSDKIYFQNKINYLNYLLENKNNLKIQSPTTRIEGKFEPNKFIYKVNINIDNFLHYENKLNDFQLKVIDELYDSGVIDDIDKKMITNKDSSSDIIYGILADYYGPKKASEILRENGILGRVYSKTKGASTNGYVVFDENAITIEEQIKFQKTRSVESRGGQRGTQFESAVAPESIVKFFNINTMSNTLDTKDAMETLSAISNYIDLDVSITSPTYSELQAFVEQLNNKIDAGSVDFSVIEEETGVTQKDIEKFLGTAEKRLASFEARNNIQFQTQPLSDKGINLTTAGFVYNGDVYLNMDNMNLDTPIHEFGHLWLSWAKNNLGEAYARGLELAKSSEADPYRQYVMDTQPDLKVDSTEFLEEVLAQAIGDNGARLVEENSTKTKSWLQDLWDAIGKMLGLSQFTADQIMNMTLNDYAKAVAIDLLSGRNITTSPEAEKTIRFSNGETAQVKPINYDVVNGFYSPIEKRLSETKIDKQSANKWLSVIGKGDEATWTGVKAWLEEKNPQEQVTKSEIQQWMKDNRIEISEVVKGQGELNVVPMEDEPNILEVFAADDPNGDYRGNIGEIIIEKNGKFTANIPEAPQKTFNTQKEAEDYIKSKTNYAEQTKFSQYQLEGEKENYKEVLVTLPPTETQLSEIQKNALDAKSAEELAETMFRSSNIRLTEDAKDNGYTDSDGSVAQSALSLAMYNEGDDNFYGRKRLEERLEYLVGKEQLQQAIKLGEDVNNSYKKATELKNKPPKGGFKSSHFEELNILVHLRMNTRTDAEGNKVLFLEEVQSDWGQQGKKQGFKQTNLEQLKNQLVEAENEYNKLDFINLKLSEVMNTPEAKKVEELREKINAEEKAITPAPFVMDTNAWTKLGLKVALKEAVKQGADKIAWTTGEQQNDRYDLSKQVDKLYITKSDKDGSFRVEAFKNGEKSVYNAENVNKLSDIVGKDIADRAENGMETFEGDNLKVGGKGMKGFYGSPTEGSLGIVGNVAKSLFKQEPKVVQINSASKEAVSKLRVEKINEDGKQWVLKDEEGTIRGRFYTEQAAKEELSERVIRQKEYAQKNISTQYSIDITPELKEQVAEGLPMFQKKQDEGSENLLPLSQVIPIEETTTIPECV